MPKGIHGSVAPHGTWARYNHHSCRCVECRVGARVYLRRIYGYVSREEYLARIEPPHGTESRYNSSRFRCRCKDCKAASAQARKRRKWADIEATRAYDRRRRAA